MTIIVETQPAPEGIHILSNGLPLCRFSLAAPSEWPVGQLWTDLTRTHLASCPHCIEQKSKAFAS